MNTRKIVVSGGPGTGKTVIIEYLKSKGYECFEEISRQVTLEAQKDGIDQLFLAKPLLFSKMLLQGRIQQFNSAKTVKKEFVFLDRGIPDIVAYMDYLGTEYPDEFREACKKHQYDVVFILAPWQEIFKSDNERYENFEQAVKIHNYLVDTYKKYSYRVIDVPFGSIKDRTQYILNSL